MYCLFYVFYPGQLLHVYYSSVILNVHMSSAETVTFVERLFRYLHGLTTSDPKQHVSGPSSQITHRRSHSRSPVSGHSGSTLPQPTIDPNTRYQPQTVSVLAGDAGSSALTSSRDRDREAQQRREDRFGALSANESDLRRGGDIRVDKRGERGDRGVRSGDFRDHRDQGRDMRDRERDRDFRMVCDRDDKTVQTKHIFTFGSEREFVS